MKLKKIHVKNFFFIAIILLIFLSIINFIFFFTAPIFVKNGIFPRTLINALDPCYMTLYHNTHNSSNDGKYTIVLGDSYGEGSGDEFLNNSLNYGLIKKIIAVDNKNYAIYARGGYESLMSFKEWQFCEGKLELMYTYKKHSSPKEFLITFYEGNDLNNVIKYVPSSKLKILSRNLRIYFPFYDMVYFSIKTFFIKAHWKIFKPYKNRMQRAIPENTILFENKKHIVNIFPQAAALELDEQQINLALESFENTVRKIMNFNELNIIKVLYIPSVVSTYEWEEPIKTQSYHSNKPYFEANNKKNDHNNILITKKIRLICNKNNCNFCDATSYLKDKGKNNLIHGPKDWKHFNSIGYKALSEKFLLCEEN